MKQFISAAIILCAMPTFAQRNAPKMAPIYTEGYYVSQRSDTVRGEIQINIEDKTTFNKKFAFRANSKMKPRDYDTRRAKAYGFEGREFVMKEYDGERIFVERLAFGRLALYEYKFHGKINGLPAIESAYFVRDTWDQEQSKTLTKISNKFYKKSLKPFMKEEQPEIWEHLDKFTFDKRNVIQAINEFNARYATAAN
jgi:hypothetical protein